MTQRRLSLMMALAMTIALVGGCNFPTREPPPQPLAGNSVIVQQGQSIYDIARQHGVSAEDLAATNGVLPPYRLTAGQVLQLPPQTQLHTVQTGDTLLSIARNNQVEADQLAAVNGLAPPYTIYPGQVLTVPSNAPSPAYGRRRTNGHPRGRLRLPLPQCRRHPIRGANHGVLRHKGPPVAPHPARRGR